MEVIIQNHLVEDDRMNLMREAKRQHVVNPIPELKTVLQLWEMWIKGE
jgi:hypothetical protein